MSKENPLLKVHSIIAEELWQQRDEIIGKVLTVIDGSISDQEQRKGLKDVIKQIVYADYKNWGAYRIGRLLLEFNEKFAKLKLTENEIKYLDTGERSFQGEQTSHPPIGQLYFN